MSASREKKQRQSVGPDQKALKAQQEQAARRRTTIIYSVIAAVIAVLVIALLVWRSGFFQARAAAATLGDETLTAAELSFYYYDARRYTVQLAAYNMTTFDTTKADDKQFYSEADGQTYRDYFMETALTNARYHKALAEEAVKLGHSKDEVKETVDAYIASLKSEARQGGYTYSAYLRALYGPYMNSSILEKLYTRYQMAGLAAGDKDAELFDGYTQADLEAYYEEHKDSLDTVEYSSLYFAIPTVNEKDADGNDLSEDELNKLKEEAKASAKEKAEEALEAVEGGATFQSQIDKYELTGTTNADHNKVVGTGSVNTTFSEQLFALDEDECELVETDNGYYVISFHGRYLNDEPTRDVLHIAILADTTTDDEGNVAAPTDDAWAAAKEKMDAIEAEWKAGEQSQDAFTALAEKYNTEDVGDALVSRIASTNTTLVPEFKDWVFQDHQPGDSGVIQHSAADSDRNKYWAYHLMFYVGENEPVWMSNVRSTKAEEDRQAWMDELSANYPATLTGGANYLGK